MDNIPLPMHSDYEPDNATLLSTTNNHDKHLNSIKLDRSRSRIPRPKQGSTGLSSSPRTDHSGFERGITREGTFTRDTFTTDSPVVEDISHYDPGSPVHFVNKSGFTKVDNFIRSNTSGNLGLDKGDTFVKDDCQTYFTEVKVPSFENTPVNSNHNSPLKSAVFEVKQAKNQETKNSKSADSRIPRYGASYTSYEQILNNMNDSDPFSREQNSSMRRSRQQYENGAYEMEEDDYYSRRTRRQRPPSKRFDNESENGNQPVPAHRKKKKRHNDRDRNPLESTYTISQNSGFNGIRPRKDSLKSNDTYTVPSDDNARLIKKPSSGNNMELNSRTPNDEHTWSHDPRKGQRSMDLQERDVKEYVTNNIKCKKCKEYIYDEAKKGKCQCGLDQEWHRMNLHTTEFVNTGKKWNKDKHTTSFVTDAFGTISFQGFGQEASKNAPFVRVSSDCDTSVVYDLLAKYWKMPEPKLIISVTGGAKRFFMKNRLLSSFKRGLINAATSTGAWIITGGTNAGVMQLVGEAVKDHMLTTGSSEQSVVALGIGTWGAINNNESLVNKGGSFPAVYKLKDLKQGVKGATPLDHNHTHFILVDDGTNYKFGAEIDMRGELEKHISKYTTTGFTDKQSDRVHVPVVCLVLEGGVNTLRTAEAAIENGTPVVAIQGSGKAADLIAYALNLTKKTVKKKADAPTFTKSQIEQLRDKAENIFELKKEDSSYEENLKKIITTIGTIVSKKHLVSVFHLDDDETTNEIDQAILMALLNANKSNAQSQLNLALAWNRADVARTEIFRMDNRENWQKKIDFDDAMFKALVYDRFDFVRLFLDNGLSLKEFLTTRKLRDLYYEVIHDEYAGSCADLLRNQLQDESSLLCCRSNDEGEKRHLLVHVGDIIKSLLGAQSSNLYGDAIIEDEGEKDTSPAVENPERELFLWALLLNRKEFAELFWKNGIDHIGSALIGSALLKSLAAEADKEEEIDLSTDLKQHSEKFEEIACGVLNESYSRDKIMAHRLLVREQRQWSNTTTLTIADMAEHMDFMGQPCTQTKLNKIWKGKMALYTQTWKIMLNMIFPFFMFLIKFASNEFDYTKKREKKSSSQDSRGSPNKVSPDGVSKDLDMDKRPKTFRKLYQVTLCSNNDNGDDLTISWFRALYHFHTAPTTKFMYHTLAQLVFLCLFSFFVLTDLHPLVDGNEVSIYEYIVWGWTATLFIEEIRQIITGDAKSFSYKLRGYFSSIWNQFDQAMYVLFIISVVLRYTLKTEDDFVWTRIFYALTLAMFFLRFMHVFYVDRNIGPKVIMINRMLTDLTFFLSIFLVFILAYGVASQALRYPNAPAEWGLLKDVVYLPYWQIYGELFLEDIEGDVGDCSSNRTEWMNDPDIKRCPEESTLAIILLAVYMIMTNILLLNLLIAMFSFTFEKVQENSEKVWRFYRYEIIHEYFDRPTLAPPLIILSHIQRIIKFLIWRCRHGDGDGDGFSHDFKNRLEDEDNKQLTAFEKACMENYHIIRHQMFNEHIDAKVTSAQVRIEKVIGDLEQIKESVGTSGGDAPMTSQHIEPLHTSRTARDETSKLQNKIFQLESVVENQGAAIRQILSLVKDIHSNQGPRRAFAIPPDPQIDIGNSSSYDA